MKLTKEHLVGIIKEVMGQPEDVPPEEPKDIAWDFMQNLEKLVGKRVAEWESEDTVLVRGHSPGTPEAEEDYIIKIIGRGRYEDQK